MDPACCQELWLGRPPERRAVRAVRAAQAGAGGAPGWQVVDECLPVLVLVIRPHEILLVLRIHPAVGVVVPCDQLASSSAAMPYLNQGTWLPSRSPCFQMMALCLLVMMRIPCSSSNE